MACATQRNATQGEVGAWRPGDTAETLRRPRRLQIWATRGKRVWGESRPSDGERGAAAHPNQNGGRLLSAAKHPFLPALDVPGRHVTFCTPRLLSCRRYMTTSTYCFFPFSYCWWSWFVTVFLTPLTTRSVFDLALSTATLKCPKNSFSPIHLYITSPVQSFLFCSNSMSAISTSLVKPLLFCFNSMSFSQSHSNITRSNHLTENCIYVQRPQARKALLRLILLHAKH